MLNLAIGSHREIDGKTCILTRERESGHAIYGPYEHLAAGHYAVEFNLAAAEGQNDGGDDVCGMVEVVSDFGQKVFARENVALSHLRGGPVCVRLAFHTDVPRTFEYRVAVNGRIPLVIEDHCRVLTLGGADTDYTPLFDETAFPSPPAASAPDFFTGNQRAFRRLFENGAIVKIIDGGTVVTIDGVSFHANTLDDLRFIDEIFFRGAYNFSLGNACCVIDIGMNIGLVSLMFARKEIVKEVHSFEPFRGTYQRACANLLLNPDIASKINAHNFGLAAMDEEKTVLIANVGDSGAFSIRGSARGTPEPIVVRNAASVLRPIIEAAKAKGRAIIAKVDCEGSEFPIFRTLDADGLLSDISAFMVEWHRGIDGQTQHDLIAPLIRNGFMIFDQTGKTGNGFFYAVKCAPAPPVAT